MAYIEDTNLIDEIKSLTITVGGKHLFPDIAKKSVLTIINEQPIVDVIEQKHGYWTGRTYIDDAPEGFATWMTRIEKEYIRDKDKHVTHCSVCGGMFDDRQIKDWKGCPYCLSIMDLEKPEDAYFRAWETYEKRSNIKE